MTDKVLDFNTKRQENIEEKRRNFERVMFQNFLGCYTVIHREGVIYPVELVDISADTIEDQEGNTFYRVKLRTDKTELTRKGEVLPITVGMVASVDILTGKKTVMDYLLKPFRKTLENAMNER